MNEWKIVVTPQFENELRNIYTYISGRLFEPEIAKRFVEKVFSTVKTLKDFPMRFPVYENEPWRSRGLRRISVDNYLVFYLINKNLSEIIILHIFYSGRNMRDA